MKTVNLYFKYIFLHLKSIAQYKMSFLLLFIGQFLTSFNIFLGIFYMFKRFNTLDDFTYNQVLLCYSIVLTGFSIAECFGRGFDNFSSILGNGVFDRIMLRPQTIMFQILVNNFEFARLSRILQAIVLFVYSASKANINWDSFKALTVVFMIIGTAVLFMGIFITCATFCFFTLENLEFMNIFTDGAKECCKYPIGVYGKRVVQFCTFFIPYALVQYYPLIYILDKSNNFTYVFLPLISFVFLIPCFIFWKFGTRHYKSIGS